MDILCLMGLFPREFEQVLEKNSIVGMQNAANKLQWNIVHGLDAQENVHLQICNSIYVGAYPKKYRTYKIPSFSFAHRPGAKDYNIGFLNLPYIKIFSRYFGVRKAIAQWAEEPSVEQKVLLVYALTTPFVQLAEYTHKHFPNVKICIVVPDLPEYMNVGFMQKKRLYAKMKQIEIRIIRHAIRNIRSFVLLTDAMATWFDHEIDYTVVEGIADPKPLDYSIRKDFPKTIIYAGGIKREYGVADLVSAFMAISSEEWKLTIYGDGVDLNYVRELAKDDPRISFPGSVPNAVVVEAQKRASLLVNPRRNQELTKYSFPSKVLEYMSSGTPMLAYRLDGVPSEYSPFYYQIDPSEGGLQRSLRQVMELPEKELRMMGLSAYQFVSQRKNPEVQSKKILQMLSE